MAEAVAWLNGFLAVVIVLFCAIVGWSAANSAHEDTAVGLLVGTLGGVLLAMLYCGAFALWVQMHHELKGIRKQLSAKV
jgi:hypothetical protein